LINSSQPFPLRQICLNDLLNADISSIVTSLSQPHGKIEDVTCSNFLLEGTVEHRWDLNQDASARLTDVENLLHQNGTIDIQRSTKLCSPVPSIEDGGTVLNSLLGQSEEYDIFFLTQVPTDVDLSSIAQDFSQVDVKFKTLHIS
jgi:hypothetical protein